MRCARSTPTEGVKRRDTIFALLGVSVAGPSRSLRAQVSRTFRIGFLSTLRLPQTGSDEFDRSLRELGYSPGENLFVEVRVADAEYERLPALAAEFAQMKLDLIVALGSSAIHAARKAIPETPIVMIGASDPVASGFVKSLARPGGNITGVANIDSELSAKLVELIAATVPLRGRLGLLAHPGSPSQELITARVQTAARNAGVALILVEARTPKEIEGAIEELARERVGAIVVSPSSLFYAERRQIADLALNRQLPTAFGIGGAVQVGGMMSYTADFREILRRAASYVDKILKGAKPAELPVEQPTRFILAINMKTAKALGASIPASILIRASNVIE